MHVQCDPATATAGCSLADTVAAAAKAITATVAGTGIAAAASNAVAVVKLSVRQKKKGKESHRTSGRGGPLDLIEALKNHPLDDDLLE